MIPGWFPAGLLLIRTGDVAVAMGGVHGYPNGFEFTVHVKPGETRETEPTERDVLCPVRRGHWTCKRLPETGETRVVRLMTQRRRMFIAVGSLQDRRSTNVPFARATSGQLRSPAVSQTAGSEPATALYQPPYKLGLPGDGFVEQGGAPDGPALSRMPAGLGEAALATYGHGYDGAAGPHSADPGTGRGGRLRWQRKDEVGARGCGATGRAAHRTRRSRR
jgi:hypothetical protein